MDVTDELKRLKTGIRARTIKLPKPQPPSKKVKGRQIIMSEILDISGDLYDDMEYLKEFNKVLKWSLYTNDLKDLEKKFKSEHLNYFYYKNSKVYHFGLDETDIIFIIK